MKGIFNAKVTIAAVDGRITVTLDGATDALGFGEALGVAAAGWLESTESSAQRMKEFEQMLIGFIALSSDRVGSASGTVERINIGGEQPPGRVS